MTDEKKPPQGAGGLRLYAGVDVMADRLEVGIYAFTPFAKQVAALTLWGDPSQDKPWRLLHAQLCACSGLRAVGVDSGGHHTRQVYRFALASNRPESGAAHEVFATKFRSSRGSGQQLGSMLVEAGGLGGMLEEKIKVLLLVSVEDDPASPDVLKCAMAVHDWIFSIGLSNPLMGLKPVNPGVEALRVRCYLNEAELKIEEAGRATCPLQRERLLAESSLSLLRAREIADRQAI